MIFIFSLLCVVMVLWVGYVVWSCVPAMLDELDRDMERRRWR